jgi:hypothetical protein
VPASIKPWLPCARRAPRGGAGQGEGKAHVSSRQQTVSMSKALNIFFRIVLEKCRNVLVAIELGSFVINFLGASVVMSFFRQRAHQRRCLHEANSVIRFTLYVAQLNA